MTSYSVPAYPIETERKNAKQRQFYNKWVTAWQKGQVINIGTEYGYLFDHIRDFIKTVRKKADATSITSELSALRKAYPYTGGKGNGSFHHYCLEYIADSYVLLQQYDGAIEILSEGYNLIIPANVNKILSLKSFIGDDVSGMDLLFLWGVPQLTQWGRSNLRAVSECAEQILTDKRQNLKSKIVTLWASESKLALGDWDPIYKTYPIFEGITKRFKSKIPYHYFNYVKPFSESVPEITRQAENMAREHQGIPRVGEGWVSETELYYLIKKAFPDLDVQHHASPDWLGRQHLDIFIPSMKVAIEFQGKQHEEPVEFFGGKKAFEETKKRDAKKLELCKKNGVWLVYVYPGYSIEDVVAQVKNAG